MIAKRNSYSKNRRSKNYDGQSSPPADDAFMYLDVQLIEKTSTVLQEVKKISSLLKLEFDT